MASIRQQKLNFGRKLSLNKNKLTEGFISVVREITPLRVKEFVFLPHCIKVTVDFKTSIALK